MAPFTSNSQPSKQTPKEGPAPSGGSTDRLLEAEPVVIGERRIQPVARFVGKDFTGNDQTGPFVSQAGRLTPLEVRVDRDGTEEVIPIDDPLQEPLRGIFMVGAAVSAVCIGIMLVARGAARRQLKRR